MSLHTPPSDAELLRLMSAGDEDAFTALYRRRQAGVYRFALQMSGSEAVAEDVTQEVFMVLMRDADKFDPTRGSLAAYLYGKVTGVLGTHTHIQTNDARVSPGGTAAVTDAGMTGPHDSVIGVVTELAVQQMLTGIPIRFRTASGGVRLEGVLIECGDDGRATSCELVRVALEQPASG